METNPAGESIPFKAAPILRKAPFNIEELEKKNRELEILVRKKFINGEVHARKGDENFYCDVEYDYQATNMKNSASEQMLINHQQVSDEEALEDPSTLRTTEIETMRKHDDEEVKNDSNQRL